MRLRVPGYLCSREKARRQMNKKQSYTPPRCEMLVLSTEGIIAFSYNYNGFEQDEILL